MWQIAREKKTLSLLSARYLSFAEETGFHASLASYASFAVAHKSH